MLSIPNSFMAGSIVCYPAVNDAATFYCLPDAPTPDRDAQGRPILMIFSNGPQAQLQMSVRWSLSPSQLAALPPQIARRFPEIKPEAIRLISPLAEVKSVTLMIGDGQGGMMPAGEFHSSGMPPYTTLIKLPLTEQQQGSVLSALQRRPGFVSARYEIALPIQVSATTVIKGNLGLEISQLRMRTYVIDPTPMMIDQAIAEKRLVLMTEAADLVSEELKAATVSAAKQQAINALRQLGRKPAGGAGGTPIPKPADTSASGPKVTPIPGGIGSGSLTEEGTIDIKVTQTETAQLHWSPEADVSTWFDGSVDITDHLLIQPGGGQVPTEKPANISIGLSFDASDTPVNFILVKQKTQQATLQSPSFEAVSLAITPGEPLEITTNYTDGGPPFSHTLDAPAGQQVQLNPPDVGLAAITLDASALAEAGMKAARVRVRYFPESTGSDDDRTIHLRNREWTSTWYIVTRAASLAGSLRYETKLTAANGAITNSGEIEVTAPVIVLQPGISNS